MTVHLKHQFVNPQADGADTTITRPSDWNADHNLTGTPFTGLGFDASGNATEIAGRTVVSVATDYYVNPSTGSDSNVGSAGSPWQTIAHAIHVVCDLIYIQNAAVTIHLANGTYAEFVLLRDYYGTPGLNSNDSNGKTAAVVILGDVNTPHNVIIKPSGDPTSNGFSVLFDPATTPWSVNGVELDASNLTTITFARHVGLEGPSSNLRLNDYNLVVNSTAQQFGRFFLVRENGYLHTSSYTANSTGKVLVTGGSSIQAAWDTSSGGEIYDECFYDFTAVSPFTVSIGWMNITAGFVTNQYGNPMYSGTVNGGQYFNDFGARVATGGTVFPGSTAGAQDNSCSIDNMLGIHKVSGAPNTTISSPNFLMTDSFAVFKDTSGGGINIYANDAGTIKALGGGAPGGSSNSIQYNNSGSFAGLGPLTNGQLVIGSTGAAPVAATLTAGANVTITNAAGAITIAATSGSGIVVNTTGITGGTTKHVAYDNAGTFGEAGNFTIESGNPNVTAGNEYRYANTQALIADPPNNNWHLFQAGNLTMSGVVNLTMGINAGSALTSGSNNVLFGANAGSAMTTSSQNVAIGRNALSSAVTAAQNCVSLGYQSMSNAAGGNSNVGIGFEALQNVSGDGNVGLGQSALFANMSGSNNLGVGSNNLSACTTGNGNCSVGASGMASLTTGHDNVALGTAALAGGTDLQYNMALGAQALRNTSGSHFGNVGIGYQAGYINSTGDQNIAIGYQAYGNSSVSTGSGNGNIVIGTQSGFALTSGSSNVILGTNENFLSTGNNNIILGSGNGAGLQAQSATSHNQLNIGNYIYGTGFDGNGSTLSNGFVGFGVKAPTAVLHLQASTTSRANLRFDPTSAAGPSSPNDGDMWYDGTHLKFRAGGVTTTIV